MDTNYMSLVALIVIVLFTVYTWIKRPRNFPPGPRGWPFVGNLLSLGPRRHITLTRWKEQYGDVFSYYDGRIPVVVLSNFDTVRKVFSDDASTGRRPASAVRADTATLGPNMGVVFSQGDLWKTHRRFALSTLRNLGMGKNWLEDMILGEVEAVCQVLRNTNRAPFNAQAYLTNSVANVICALSFGQRFELTDPRFTRLTSMLAVTVANTVRADSVAAAFPFLTWFPNKFRETLLRLRGNIRAIAGFLGEHVRDHATLAAKDSKEGLDAYVYSYQKESETVSNNSFNEQQLVASLYDFFLAGTETTTTTTLWALVFMVENPDILRKVQEEIDGSVGRETTVTTSDRGRLPYTQAVIEEVQRCASVVSLGVPHRSRQDITVNGYTISQGTMLTANLFSIHRDIRWWKNPETFDPQRFLDGNMKLTRPDGFAPFAIGKRACLGEALARMELFLLIANLLRSFDLQLPPGKTLSHHDYTTGLALCPTPFELIFSPRY